MQARVSADGIERVHARLRAVSIVLPAEPDAATLRDLFAKVRANRNRVARILGTLLPLRGRLRAALARVERRIEDQAARTIDGKSGFIGCRTEADKKARIKVLLSEDYDEKALLEEDLAIVSEATEHARLVLEEQRAAFEEASRSLSSIDLEFRVETA